MHEAQRSPHNCFLTLTYDDAHLPADGSLDHAHFQRFIRYVRRKHPGTRYYMCGEYGPELGRPHYHACIFGLNFRDRTPWKKSDSGELAYTSPTLSTFWPHGMSTVQDLTHQSAAYCARYIIDKITGDLAPAYYGSKKPEYARMSLKPGVGAFWFHKYSNTDLIHDYVIRSGRQAQVPRYYDKLLKRKDPNELADRKLKRAAQAHQNWQDNTPERLAVKETVQRARIEKLQRKLK